MYKRQYKYLVTLITPRGADVTHRRFTLLDTALSLYYYPVYFVKYSYRGIIHTITVDAVNGNIVGGEAPAVGIVKIKNLIIVPLVGAIMAFAFLPLPIIALTILYAYDTTSGGKLVSPVEWFQARLASWIVERK